MAIHTAIHGSGKRAKAKPKPAGRKYETIINKMPKPRKRPMAPVEKFTDNEIAVGAASSFDTFVIFDLDGCVSDDSWRFGFVQERVKNDDRWEHYHKSLHLDTPLMHGGDLLMRCVASKQHPIFITARPNAFRAATAKWLENNFGLVANKTASILMRDDNDPTATVQVKRALLSHLLSEVDRSSIVAAYDDREDVVTMYNAAFGINAYVLDKDGVSDPLNLQSFRTRHLAPEHAERIDKAVAGMPFDDQPIKNGRPTHPVADALEQAAATIEDRAAKYGRADLMAGDVAAALFPNGVEFGGNSSSLRMGMMMFHVIGKLSRFASSGMKNSDSVHDMINYAAFMDAIMNERAGSPDDSDPNSARPDPVQFL